MITPLDIMSDEARKAIDKELEAIQKFPKTIPNIPESIANMTNIASKLPKAGEPHRPNMKQFILCIGLIHRKP